MRGGEFEKALLLHGAGIVLLGLLLERGFSLGDRAKARWTPVLIAAVLVGLSHALSSLLAVEPIEALLGSFHRAQGLATQLFWLVLFVALIAWAQARRVRERLFSALVLSSIPVSAYGLLQRCGLDPLPWSLDMSERCSSTLGNPVFLGGYLAMLLPTTAYLAIQSWQVVRPGSGQRGKWPYYFAAFVLQVVALWATGSRGPLLGAVTGMSVFAGLTLALRGLRRRAAAWLASGALAGLVFFVFAASFASGWLRTTMLRQETIRIRVVLWESVARLLGSREPTVRFDGGADRFQALRPWIGYGPECLAWVFDPYYPPELGRLENKTAIPDRAHNEMLDVLVATGLAGLASTWILYGTLFLAAMNILRGERARRDAPETASDSPTRLMAAALISGIVAHGVDVQFGFRTICSGTLFWTYCAMLATPGRNADGQTMPDRSLRRGWLFRAVLWTACAGAVGLLCVRPFVADLFFARGLRARESREYSRAIAFLEWAALLQPREETYLSVLGKTRYLQALSENVPLLFDRRIEQALRDLHRARTLNPLRSENTVNLAGLYTGWAALTTEPNKRRVYAGQAEACFAEATRISPNRASIWVERAMLHLNVLENPKQAEQYLLAALDLDMDNPAPHAWLGRYYERMAALEADEEDRDALYRLALRHYEWTADLAKEGHRVTRLREIYLRMVHLCRLLGNEKWAEVYEAEASNARSTAD